MAIAMTPSKKEGVKMSIETPRREDPLPTAFKEAYRWAIHSILRFQEQTASIRLKHAFERAILDPKDNEGAQMHGDLDAHTRGLLFGDYKSDSAYPWIADPRALGIVVDHARIFREDETVIANFVARTREAYGVTPALRLAA